jgi:general secretion pathway protein D
VALEVSTLGAAVKTNSGTLAYQIGTRNASTLLRLRDGETQMLAGLISRDDRSTASRIPGAGDLPVLGRLFSDQQDTANRTELVLAITPRVLRNVRKLEAQEAELWVGTEAAPKLRSYGGLRADLSVPGGAQVTAAAQNRSDARTAPGAPTSESANGATSGNASTPNAKDKSLTVHVGWSGPAQVKAGEIFTVQILVHSDLPLRGMPTELSYDKARLQLIDAEEGEFFKQNGAATSFSKGGDNATGKLTVGVIRNQATGAQGDGVALLLKFKALTSGVAQLQLDKFTPLTLGASAPAAVAIAPLLVRVDP